MREPVFCPHCGELLDALQRRIDEQDATIEELSHGWAAQRSVNRRLRNQNTEIPPELYEQAMDVLHYWKAKIQPTARELNGTRLQKTADRLSHGYTVEDLKRAIDGFAHRPNLKYGRWVTPEQGGDFKADPKYMMADATRVDEGLRIAERYDPRPPDNPQLPL